jgi:hypothetical protein
MAVFDATIKAIAAAIMQSSFFIPPRHIAAIPPAFLTLTLSASSLPMRSLNMIAPSRGIFSI